MKRLLTLFLIALLTLTVTRAEDYVKVNSNSELSDGQYLIVYETGNIAFNGGLTSLDAVGNYISVTISNSKIESNATTDAASFTITSVGNNKWTIKSASDYYIGRIQKNNGMDSSPTNQYLHEIAVNSGNATIMAYGEDGTTATARLQYYSTSGSSRFRYYTSNQKTPQLYKLEGSGNTIAAPTITPDGGDILASQQVSMSAEDGASIYYTINGNNPTTSSTLYTAPFTLNSSATVKAIAVKDGVSSTVTSATFNVVAGVPDIAAALNTTEQFIFAGNAVVVYQHGSYLYIKDDSGWGLVYGSVDGTYNNGDILDRGWKATKTVYNGLPEFGSPVANTFRSTSSGTAVEPVALTTITSADLNKYATMSSITITESSSGNYSFEVNGTVYQLRNQINVEGLPDFTVGKTYNVRGFGGIYEKNNQSTYQFYPIWAEEVVSSDPTITLNPTSLTIDDSGTNNSFTVTARNLHENDNGNVSVAHNWVFSTTLTSSTNSVANWNGLQGFNRNNRSVDGTVTVNYEGRALTATDTYTVATEGANQTLTVTYVPNLYIYCDNGVSPWDFTGNPAIAMTNNGDGTYTATLQDIPANSHILFGRASGLTYNWENDDNRLFFGASTDGSDWGYGANTSGYLDTDPSNDNPVKYHPIYFSEGGTYTITINASAYTFTITKKEVHVGNFYLVTSIDDISEGDEIIIANKGEAGTYRAMGERRTDNYYGTDVIIVNQGNDFFIADDEDALSAVEILVIEGSDESGWYFKTLSDNKYLYAASSSKNYLRVQNEKDDNSKAEITINSSTKAAAIEFQGDNTRNKLRYNVNNGNPNDIFSCYASGMADVFIYRRSAQIATLSADKEHITLVTPAGADASEPQTFTVTGTNLTQNVTITVDNANFEIDPTTIAPVDGSVSQEVTVTYVGESAVTENAIITITSSGKTVEIDVHGSKAAVSLAIIESNTVLLNKKVTVDGQLIGAWAVNNGTKKLLWAKDQGQASINKRPSRTEAQDDYMVNRMKYQHYEFEGEYDWDESNWVILDFANLDGEDPENYVGHKLANKTVTGTYDNAVDYTITLTKAPTMVDEDKQDAPEYPGYAGGHASDNYGTKYKWAYNTYMPANFMPDNLNHFDADTVAGAHSGENALPNMQKKQLYFMNPKFMEVAHLWGVWCGQGSDKFTIYATDMENNQTINAWDLHGAVDVLSWEYNRLAQDAYGAPQGLDQTAQDFHAVIVRKPQTAGGRHSAPSINYDDPSSNEYGIYPLDMPNGGQPTAVKDLNANKQIQSVRYYNVMGIEAGQPHQGVNIVVTRFTDGSTSTIKVLF